MATKAGPMNFCVGLQACGSGHAAGLAARSLSADAHSQPASGPAAAAASQLAADEVPSDCYAGVISHGACSATSTA